jgi:hypothetical protein
MFALAVPQLAVQEVVPRLYPDVAGQRSAYYPFIGRTWQIGLLLLAALTLAIAGPWLLDLESTGLWVTLGVAVLFVSTASLLLPVGQENGPAVADQLIESTLAETLSAVGYECLPRPKTDNPAVDPMIATVDLLAVSGDTAYAMKIVAQDEPAATPDRSLALEIQVGAAALQESMNSGTDKQISVRPYLLVVGGDIPAEFWSLVGEIGVKAVHVADPAVLRQPSANRADIVLRVLQLPAVTPATGKVAAA